MKLNMQTREPLTSYSEGYVTRVNGKVCWPVLLINVIYFNKDYMSLTPLTYIIRKLYYALLMFSSYIPSYHKITFFIYL